MPKIIILGICVCFLLTPPLSFAKDIYVAKNGNDTTGDGTIVKPYKTFTKAISKMSAGDVCIIRQGVYEQVLNVNKNGTSSNYLTFRAANGENVEIRATRKINGWETHTQHIYKATVNMTTPSRFRAIYHNEQYMDLARWPNNTDNNRWTVDCVPVNGGNGSHFTVDDIPNVDWTGGMVYYLGAHSGTSWTRTISSNTTNRINFTSVSIDKWPFTPHNPTVWRDYPGNNRGQLYLFNKLAALDYANEWYYDNSTNTLYLQTADGNMPADGAVEYATNKYAAELSGDYIVLEGINFFGGGIRINNNADNNQILNCKVTHGSEGYDSLTNTSAQVGEAAIEVLGDNTIIKGCTVNHSSVSGILIAGWAADNCIVEGNIISNTNYVGIHASPIRTSGDNIKILKNTIFNAGRDGMYVAGTGCEIAYNDVSASQKINSDSGIFYTVGNDKLKNNEIHHNWFHDASAPSYSHNPNDPGKAAGIYLDNNSKGYTVHHNVIWNVSWSGYQVNWNNTHLDFYHNTIWNAERAMDAWVNGYVQENNKIYNNFSNVGDWFSETAKDFDIQDNLISNVSPFEDANNQNFMPSSGSAVIDKGRIISGFSKPYKGNAPDIGAYERVGTRWTAGINAIEDTGQGKGDADSVLETQFTIAVISETCPNQNNGILNISANLDGDYQLRFNGKNYGFIMDKSITDIPPGSYQICFTIKDKANESKCFTIEIAEATELALNLSLNKKALSVAIIHGSAPFNVFVNDSKVFETMSKTFEVPVLHGDTVKIKSDKECEGELIKSIDFYSAIQPFPNPTTENFQITLPINEGKIPIEIYNIHAELISSKIYTINSGQVNLSLRNSPSGMYFIRLVLDKPKHVKIAKK